MTLYRRIETFAFRLLQWVWTAFITIHEYKNIIRKRRLFSGVRLSAEQKRQIDDFYKANYGKKIPHWWHRLYQSYTGRFDPQYFPEILFSRKLEGDRNKRTDAIRYENKNMLGVLFGHCVKRVRVPETYLMCVNGELYDGERNLLSEESARQRLQTLRGDAVAKPAVDSNSGRGVYVMHVEGETDTNANRPVREILSQLGQNYVIQERIRPHESFSRLYPKAINTLRVMTYVINGKIAATPVTLRIGQGGGMVDNAHAGGIFVGVSDEGLLEKEAFTEYQKRYSAHPDTGVRFEGYRLPQIPEIRRAAVLLHRQIPMFRFVSWDFTVDDQQRIVLLEVNLHSQAVWLAQMANGRAVFGEDTAAMLQLIRGKGPA